MGGISKKLDTRNKLLKDFGEKLDSRNNHLRNINSVTFNLRKISRESNSIMEQRYQLMDKIFNKLVQKYKKI